MDDQGTTSYDESVITSPSGVDEPSSSLPMYLIMVSGGIPGAMLRLAADGTQLGRAADSTLVITESSVSRRHASIRVDAQGRVRLSDVGSSNGTFLNGRRLAPQVPAALRDGDRIQLGASVILKFVRLDPSDEQFQRDMFERIVRDELTGLYNRSYFLNQIGPLANYSALHSLGLAVFMLDIDRFKAINDGFGHAAGDLVLRETAGVLRESTRPEDLVARYGGEEFVLALPVAAPDLATERAEKIRARLAARPIHVGKTAVRVTASLGLAFAEAGSFRSAHALINIADNGLYQAKRAGRDRIVFGHCPSPCAGELGRTHSG